MAFETLNGREKQILRVLIDHYVSTAEPVGSRVLANRYPIGLSPATIRNTMQDLEEFGLIRQPHTSAGRVPTDEGYRTYVDNLIDRQPITPDLAKTLQDKLAAEHMRAVDDIMAQAAHVLASVTSQIGVTLAPRFDRGVVSRIELVPVAECRVLVVLGIQSGLVRTVLMEVASDIDQRSMEETQRALNERLAGQTLGSLKMIAPERLKDDHRADPRLVKLFVEAAEDLTGNATGESLHVEGASNLFSQPEFADHQVLGSILRVIEKRTPLVDLLRQRGIGEGIVVTIGREVNLEGAEGCSLVSAAYRAGEVEGTIGILGPMRMEYAKLVSIVEYTAQLLSEQMET